MKSQKEFSRLRCDHCKHRKLLKFTACVQCDNMTRDKFAADCPVGTILVVDEEEVYESEKMR